MDLCGSVNLAPIFVRFASIFAAAHVSHTTKLCCFVVVVIVDNVFIVVDVDDDDVVVANAISTIYNFVVTYTQSAHATITTTHFEAASEAAQKSELVARLMGWNEEKHRFQTLPGYGCDLHALLQEPFSHLMRLPNLAAAVAKSTPKQHVAYDVMQRMPAKYSQIVSESNHVAGIADRVRDALIVMDALVPPADSSDGAASSAKKSSVDAHQFAADAALQRYYSQQHEAQWHYYKKLLGGQVCFIYFENTNARATNDCFVSFCHTQSNSFSN